MIDRIEFVIGEALQALRRNTWMTFAAITTVAMALFLLGGLGFMYLGISSYASRLPGRFEMRAFLREGTTGKQAAAVLEEIRAMPEITWAQITPRAEAWSRYKKQFPDLVEGIDNPLPDTIEVRIKQIDKAQDVAARIGQLPEIEHDGVKYLGDLQQLLTEAQILIRWLGGALGGLMLLTSGVLIYNAIRLTIVARRREIRIMQLVGATKLTVNTPMVIEGILQGAAGGIVAALLIWPCFIGLSRVLGSVQTTIDLPPVYPWWNAIGLLSLVGAAYGMVCSILALRDPRRIR